MKAMPVATVAWLALVILAASAGFWVGQRSAAGAPLADIVTRLDRVERQLQSAGRPTPASGAPAEPVLRADSGGRANGSTAAATPRWQPPVMPSPEETARKRVARKAALEATFAAEPLDSTWAADAQSRLMQATLSDIAVQSGVAPASIDARCRSKSCRIVARFGEGVDGAGWADHYILGATGMLSSAETLIELLPDGGSEVVIYGSGD